MHQSANAPPPERRSTSILESRLRSVQNGLSSIESSVLCYPKYLLLAQESVPGRLADAERQPHSRRCGIVEEYQLYLEVGPSGLGCAARGERSPTSHKWPKGSINPPCRCTPHGTWWSRISSMEPSAPAATACSMNRSGSSTNTSTRIVLLPSDFGVLQPLFSGSPRKNGAPSIIRPTTPPKFHNSVAPTASAYQRAAAEAFETARSQRSLGSDFRMPHQLFIRIQVPQSAGQPLSITAVNPAVGDMDPLPGAEDQGGFGWLRRAGSTGLMIPTGVPSGS